VGRGSFDEFGTYPVSVIRNDNDIWAYYAGWTRCESVPFNVAIGCAVSCDGGATFEKLGNGPILSYTPDEPFVLVDLKSAASTAFGICFTSLGVSGSSSTVVLSRFTKFRVATSENGLHWNKLNRDLIPSRVEEDEAQASPDVFFSNGKYHMFFLLSI
jgi:hypothetical protein